MKILVCGSIGFGGLNTIRSIQKFLEKRGFEVLDHISEKGMDYSDISDFRDKKDLSDKIIAHDLKFVEQSDVLVVLGNKPSWGTAIELKYGKSLGRTIVLLAEDPIPTPWPISLSDVICTSKEKLINFLENLRINYANQLIDHQKKEKC